MNIYLLIARRGLLAKTAFKKDVQQFVENIPLYSSHYQWLGGGVTSLFCDYELYYNVWECWIRWTFEPLQQDSLMQIDSNLVYMLQWMHVHICKNEPMFFTNDIGDQ